MSDELLKAITNLENANFWCGQACGTQEDNSLEVAALGDRVKAAREKVLTPIAELRKEVERLEAQLSISDKARAEAWQQLAEANKLNLALDVALKTIYQTDVKARQSGHRASLDEVVRLAADALEKYGVALSGGAAP